MPTVEDTLILATKAHRGQKDKAGDPYILHPLRIMLSRTKEERLVALVHDVVEDTRVTLKQLAKAGYSPECWKPLNGLTHRPGEEYFDYVARLKPNHLARRVKLADLEDNMQHHMAAPTETDRLRLRKYRKILEGG